MFNLKQYMNYLLLILASTFGLTSWSQSFYASIAAGHQVVIPIDEPASPIVNSYNAMVNPWAYGNENFTFKQVTNFDLSFGHMFHQNIGYELTGSYLKPVSDVYENDHNVTKTFSANYFRINPKIVINVAVKKFEFVSKLGFIVNFGKANYYQRFVNGGTYPALNFESTAMNYEYTSPPSFGFNGSFGVSRKITHKIALFVDVFGTYLNFTPNKGAITEYTMNNEDLLPNYEWTPWEGQIDFGDESEGFTWTSNSPDPEKLYKRNYSLSGYGLTLGVRFTLWVKADGEPVRWK